MLSKMEQKLLDALEPKAAETGIEIVTVEIVGARKAPTICVYIDTPHGVTFDDIVAAQVWIDEMLDRIDPFPGAHTVQVSSPGIDRPLRTRDHFVRFAGEQAVVKSTQPIDGRSAWTGTLKGMQDDTVLIEVDGNDYAIPFDMVKRANVKGTIDFSRK